jgi:hypothetical protein
MADEECPICAEAYSTVVRARRECAFCHAATCKRCVERYLLSTTEDPHCMSCKQPWSVECIDAMLTRAFRTGRLKEHRENVLVDREKSMLPATQPDVERIIMDARMSKEILRLEEQRKAILDEIKKVERAQRDMWHRDNSSVAEVERRKFVKPCVVEGCRGFLSTAYKCGLCQANVCPHCHEVKNAGEVHECVPETVESVALIASDSKACPKCGSMIFRVSGCSQMFCTAPGCGTAFDWHTGRVVTSRIHNPHYYEFMRQRQARGGVASRELDDIPCGGMPSVRELNSAVIKVWGEVPYVPDVVKDLMDAHRSLTHVQEYELRDRYHAVAAPDFHTNKDLRIKYMMGSLDIEHFKRLLQAREKRRNKMGAINQVLAMMCNVASDVYRNLVISKCSIDALNDAILQITALRIYANTSLLTIRHRFTCVVPSFDDKWVIQLK